MSNDINERLIRLKNSIEEKYKRISLLHIKYDELNNNEKNLKESNLSRIQISKLLKEKHANEYNLEEIRLEIQNSFKKLSQLQDEIEELKRHYENALNNYSNTYKDSILSCYNIYHKKLHEINKAIRTREMWNMTNEETLSVTVEKSVYLNSNQSKIKRDRINYLKEMFESAVNKRNELLKKKIGLENNI